MPIIRLDEIRKMPKDKMEEKISELRTELLRLETTIRAGGNIENPSRIRELKKTIARIKTIQGKSI